MADAKHGITQSPWEIRRPERSLSEVAVRSRRRGVVPGCRDEHVTKQRIEGWFPVSVAAKRLQ